VHRKERGKKAMVAVCKRVHDCTSGTAIASIGGRPEKYWLFATRKSHP
jgi:hypothetical protein